MQYIYFYLDGKGKEHLVSLTTIIKKGKSLGYSEKEIKKALHSSDIGVCILDDIHYWAEEK